MFHTLGVEIVGEELPTLTNAGVKLLSKITLIFTVIETRERLTRNVQTDESGEWIKFETLMSSQSRETLAYTVHLSVHPQLYVIARYKSLKTNEEYVQAWLRRNNGVEFVVAAKEFFLIINIFPLLQTL